LHVLPVAVLVIPASSAARANHANSAKQYENSSKKRGSFCDIVTVNKENVKNQNYQKRSTINLLRSLMKLLISMHHIDTYPQKNNAPLTNHGSPKAF